MTQMDDHELEERTKKLGALQNQQSSIRLENAMLSEHLSRVVIERKGSLQLHLEKLEEEQEEKEQEEERSLRSTSASSDSLGRTTTVRFHPVAPPPRPSVQIAQMIEPMSLEEKCDIAEEECQYQMQYMETLCTEQNRILDDLKAVLEEAKQSIGEARRDKTDFNRDVLLLAQLNPANKPYSEDILRFIYEKTRRKRIIRDSVLRNNRRSQTEIDQLVKQSLGKKDLKDVLHAVEFDEFKIVNGQLNNRIKERASSIRHYKKVILVTMQALIATHKMLADAFARGFKVKQSLKDRAPVIKSNIECIKAEHANRERLHEAVLIAIQDQDGPPQPTAIDYMKAKSKALNLRKEIKTWLGKVEIAELTYQELEKSMSLINRDMASRGVTA